MRLLSQLLHTELGVHDILEIGVWAVKEIDVRRPVLAT